MRWRQPQRSILLESSLIAVRLELGKQLGQDSFGGVAFEVLEGEGLAK